MKGSTAYSSIQKRGLHIGLLPEMAAAVNPSTPSTLDHDLDALPEVGRRLTVAQYADHVDDLAARLWAAGVRPDEHVFIYKTAGADHWMLASAISRIGGIVVNISPALDPATVGVLLERVGRPTLLADDALALQAQDGSVIAHPGSGEVFSDQPMRPTEIAPAPPRAAL